MEFYPLPYFRNELQRAELVSRSNRPNTSRVCTAWPEGRSLLSQRQLNSSWRLCTISKVCTGEVARSPRCYLPGNVYLHTYFYHLFYSENGKVSHYIISHRNNLYLIGDQSFPDLPSVLDFYRMHFLDTTTLIEIVSPFTCQRVPLNYVLVDLCVTGSPATNGWTPTIPFIIHPLPRSWIGEPPSSCNGVR